MSDIENVFKNLKSFQELTLGLIKGLRENIEEGNADSQTDIDICDTVEEHVNLLFQWGSNLYTEMQEKDRLLVVLTSALTVSMIASMDSVLYESLSEKQAAVLLSKVYGWAEKNKNLNIEEVVHKTPLLKQEIEDFLS